MTTAALKSPAAPCATAVHEDTSRRFRFWALMLMMAGAAALRLPAVFADLPFSYYGDELHFIKRAMAVGSGDLNPHWFHKPAFLMYVLTFFYGLYFLVGSLLGRFESVDAFAAHFLNDPGDFILIGRLVVCATGIASVWVVHLIARRVFGSFKAGLAAGIFAAVLLPMVVVSQDVKADGPSGLLMALSVYFYVKSWQSNRLKHLVIASLIGGAAIGTKYYGVLLIPTFALLELCRRFGRDVAWRAVFGRGALMVALFLAGFFVTSPYNFLDPTWGRQVGKIVTRFTDPPREKEWFDADSEKAFKPGAGSIPAATAHFARQSARTTALGIEGCLLVLLGFLATLRRRETRYHAMLVGVPFLAFVAIAVTLQPFHTSPRHLGAIYPLLCTLAWPGLLLLSRLPGQARRPRTTRWIIVSGMLLIVVLGLERNFRHTRKSLKLESRNVAHDWIVANIGDERILLDDYGPVLAPDRQAVARLRERLAGFDPQEAFTSSQKRRLDLLEEFPAERAKNFDLLGHAWWLSREPTGEELRESWRNRDMGNPLVDRLPKTLSEYRVEGVRYIVTNSKARRGYFETERAREAFPTWVAFYEELGELEPLHVVDPQKWGGKGPRVLIYELE